MLPQTKKRQNKRFFPPFYSQRTRKDNVAGVNLPVFETYTDGSDAYEFAGLSRGGQQIQILKKNYQKAVALLVELASLQTSFVTLDEVIKVGKHFFKESLGC